MRMDSGYQASSVVLNFVSSSHYTTGQIAWYGHDNYFKTNPTTNYNTYSLWTDKENLSTSNAVIDSTNTLILVGLVVRADQTSIPAGSTLFTVSYAEDPV